MSIDTVKEENVMVVIEKIENDCGDESLDKMFIGIYPQVTFPFGWLSAVVCGFFGANKSRCKQVTPSCFYWKPFYNYNCALNIRLKKNSFLSWKVFCLNINTICTNVQKISNTPIRFPLRNIKRKTRRFSQFFWGKKCYGRPWLTKCVCSFRDISRESHVK